jgi:hypothetical protein
MSPGDCSSSVEPSQEHGEDELLVNKESQEMTMRTIGSRLAAKAVCMMLTCWAPAIADVQPEAGAPASADQDSAAGPAQDTSSNANPKKTPAATAKDDEGKLKVAIYPIFGWVPFFSSSVAVPNFPSSGGGGIGGGNLIGNLAGNTNISLNGAAVFAADVSWKKWLLESEGMFGSVSGDRTSPHLDVNTSVDYGDFFVGRELGHGLTALAGFRRMGVDVGATFLTLPTVSFDPQVWDPLIGIEWRHTLSRKLFAQVRLDGGGFGVGSDMDIDAQARLEWRFAKHFGTVIGYQALQTRHSGTISETLLSTTYIRPWSYHQTYQGPIIGFGVYF